MFQQLYILIACLVFLSACSSNNSSSSAPAAPVPPTEEKNYAPPGSLTLDGGDAQLSYSDQQTSLNTLSETTPGRIGLFYKIFRLKSDRDLTIALDGATVKTEGCQKQIEPGIEITVTEDNKVISDLKNKKTADIQAGVDYDIRLYFTNYGACEKVNYTFGLLAYEFKTLKRAPPPPPKIPDGVICLTQSKTSQQKEFLFNFRLGRLDRPEIWMKTPGAVGIHQIFSADTACGLNSTLVECEPKISFDGIAFSRSLSCVADGKTISTGTASFNLKTGAGHLSCQSSGTKSYNLALTGCQIQP